VTATLNRPAKILTRTSGCLVCPECGTTTARVIYQGWYGNNLEMLRDASGIEDGARCKDHARTVEERWDESTRALKIALYRPVSPCFGVPAVLVDDIAQSTE
jgi:hypothetical protein